MIPLAQAPVRIDRGDQRWYKGRRLDHDMADVLSTLVSNYLMDFDVTNG